MALPLDSPIFKFVYSKQKKKRSCVTHGIQTYNTLIHGGVGIPGGDLMDHPMTPCADNLRTIAFTLYEDHNMQTKTVFKKLVKR